MTHSLLAQMERSPILHVGFQALDAFSAKKGRLPEPGSEDDAGEVIALAKDINESSKDKVSHARLAAVAVAVAERAGGERVSHAT